MGTLIDHTITASNGRQAFELPNQSPVTLDLACRTCGEWPDWAVVSDDGESATFYCNDHV